MSFLTSLFERGLGYSAINVARSAIMSLSLCDRSEKQKNILRIYMRGIFNKRPSLPRYTVTWDPHKMLSLFESWGDNDNLSLQQLTQKTCCLLLLLSGRRGQTIILIDINNILFQDREVLISLGDILKTTKKGFQEPQICLKAYQNKNICVVETLHQYLERTKQCRGDETQLFVSYAKPHKKISRDTLSRYVRMTMTAAGIDINRFKPHSLRSASTSAAKQSNVSLATIMAAVGWKNESTFTTFYDRKVQHNTGAISEALVSLL